MLDAIAVVLALVLVAVLALTVEIKRLHQDLAPLLTSRLAGALSAV